MYSSLYDCVASLLLYSCIKYLFSSLVRVSSVLLLPLSVLMLYNDLCTPQKHSISLFFATFRCTTATLHYHFLFETCLTLFYSSLSFFFLFLSLGFHKIYVHTRMMCCEMPTLYFFLSSCTLILHNKYHFKK